MLVSVKQPAIALNYLTKPMHSQCIPKSNDTTDNFILNHLTLFIYYLFLTLIKFLLNSWTKPVEPHTSQNQMLHKIICPIFPSNIGLNIDNMETMQCKKIFHSNGLATGNMVSMISESAFLFLRNRCIRNLMLHWQL